MKMYPIDGLWLTEAELTRYFLGQLEVESHHRARQVELRPTMPIVAEPPRRPQAKPFPVMRVKETRGIEA